MSRLGKVSAKCFNFFRQPVLKLSRRTFLSEAYQCREAWDKRLDSPILQKVNLQNLYQELDWQFSHFGKGSAIDVDIYLNASKKGAFIEDIEDIVHKFRLSPDAVNIHDSSHYAVIRLLLDAGRIDTLLKVISDKPGYGIFPDRFCLNMVMDKFLKEGKYATAARVAVSQMIQEDWENLLTTRLCVYSCHMYLRNLEQSWYFEGENVTPVPEPKELVKVRVKFIRNPYFDDHFDLKEPMALIGKTLSMFSSKIGGSEQLVASYYLLGLTLHQKWNEVLAFADHIATNKKPIYREALQLALNTVVAKPNPEEPSEEPKSSKAAEADSTKEEAIKAGEEIKQRVGEKLSSLEPAAVSDDMLEELTSLVREEVKNQESNDIEEQKKLFSKWEEQRVDALRKHLEEIRKEEALKRIEQQKLDLIEKEREIFFFENEDKLDLLIESRPQSSTESEKKDKPLSKEEKMLKDAAYVPPEVFKRRS